jgi:hypothetical protein
MVNRIDLSDRFVLLRHYRLSDVERLHEAASEPITEISPWME